MALAPLAVLALPTATLSAPLAVAPGPHAVALPPVAVAPAPSCDSLPFALPPHTNARADVGISVSPAAIVTITQPANRARRFHRFEDMAYPHHASQAAPQPRRA